MEEPGGLQSMGLLRVGHDWATSLSHLTFMHWRRKWQPTPVFLPGESGTGEPGGLPSMGSHRVGHNWSDLAAAAAMHIYGIYKDGNDNPVCETAKETQMYRTVFWTCGRGRGWDDLGEWHWNMYNIIYETNRQSRFDAWYRMLGAGALGWPRGMVRGGRWEGGSGWGTLVHLWQIHVDVWQNQYNFVK